MIAHPARIVNPKARRAQGRAALAALKKQSVRLLRALRERFGGAAGLMTKQLATITLVDEEEMSYWHVYQGWLTEAGWNGEEGYFNKPNVGVFNMNHSGIILGEGETYTLEGYAAAFDQKITGIEISLDRGKTWTFYETPVDNYDLVHWQYQLTAPSAGAYTVYIRAVEADGLKTQTVQKFLFNVK